MMKLRFRLRDGLASEDDLRLMNAAAAMASRIQQPDVTLIDARLRDALEARGIQPELAELPFAA